MSLLLYAIIDAPGLAEPRPAGVAGTAVEAISAGPLTAVVQEITSAPPVDPEALWRFEEVLEALMAEATVLPVRYGTVLGDGAAVRKMLDGRRSDFVAALDRLRGAVELGVRGRWPSMPAPVAPGPTHPGTDYLRAQLNARRRADDLAGRLRDDLGARARETRVRVLPSAGVPVTAAFLIDRAAQPGFMTAVRNLDRELDGTELVCTGPWPAYSFAETDD